MAQKVDYQFAYIENDAGFLGLEKSWNDLVSANENCHPFQAFEWNLSWWRSFADKKDDALRILVVTETRTEKIIGIAPLMLRTRSRVKILQFIGTGRSDYLGFITAFDDTSIHGALIDRILQDGNCWNCCFFSNVYDLKMIQLFSEKARGRALMSYRIYEYAPFLPIEVNFDSFVKQKSKVFRKNIRRYSLSEMDDGENYSLDKLIIDNNNVHAVVSGFAQIEKKSWKYAAGTAHLEQESDRQFWVHLLPSFAKKDWLSAWLLHYKGEPVAFIIGFTFNNKMYTHTSAYTQTSGGSGNIIRNNLIRTAFDRGLSEFDFMCGDEAYKLLWSDKKREIYQAIIARQTPLSLLYYSVTQLRWNLARHQGLKDLRLKLKKLLHGITGDSVAD